jgi:cysteine desulfurase
MHSMIYFDNSATTKTDEEIFEAMLPWMKENFGNASSSYRLGRQARVAIEEAREEIASSINAHPAEIIFTSGGTESNNAILKSACIESGLTDSLLISAIEHHAVSHPAEWLATQGVTLKVAPVDNTGKVSQHWPELLSSRRCLISFMHANNEIGIIQDIPTVKSYLPDTSFLHTDAVQSYGKIPIDIKNLHVDFMSMSAHKIHGPKGIGAMFIRKGIDFKSHQQGGGQERNRRAGTESPALIVGFQMAVRKAMKDMEARDKHMRALQSHMRSMISQYIPQARINTPMDNAITLPSILNISFSTISDGESILQLMDIAGIAVSNGSACVSGSQQPSHVLNAIGLSDKESKAAVRFSFCKDNTMEEVEQAVLQLKSIIDSMS